MFIPHIKYSSFEPFDSLVHFTTTRSGGVSFGKYEALNLGDHVLDDPVAVAQNKELLQEAFSIDKIIIPHQCHTANVVTINSGDEDLSDTDALVTNQKNVCIGILTADCVPVLLFDPVKKVIGAAHAGWRGLIHGTIENTLQQMIDVFDTKASNVLATIGPCISKPNYEVGKEVWAQFEQKFGADESALVINKRGEGKALCDIRMAARLILSSLQVGNIETSEYCTYAAKHTFFSARRDGIQSGRFLSAIMLT